METENKDWKPEVGKTAWYFCGMTNKRVFCATVLSLDENEQVGKTAIVDGPVDGNRLLNVRYLYPSMEAALASIKIYDLEGKEAVISRADGWPLKPEDCPQWDGDMSMNPKFRGGAAIGGESDAREGGC